MIASERKSEHHGNPEDFCDDDLPTSPNDSTLHRSLAADADFQSAYDAAIYEPLEAWSVAELIETIRQRDKDVDLLHADAKELRCKNQELLDDLGVLRAQLDSDGGSGGNKPDDADREEEEVKDEEADAFADAF